MPPTMPTFPTIPTMPTMNPVFLTTTTTPINDIPTRKPVYSSNGQGSDSCDQSDCFFYEGKTCYEGRIADGKCSPCDIKNSANNTIVWTTQSISLIVCFAILFSIYRWKQVPMTQILIYKDLILETQAFATIFTVFVATVIVQNSYSECEVWEVATDDGRYMEKYWYYGSGISYGYNNIQWYIFIVITFILTAFIAYLDLRTLSPTMKDFYPPNMFQCKCCANCCVSFNVCCHNNCGKKIKYFRNWNCNDKIFGFFTTMTLFVFGSILNPYFGAGKPINDAPYNDSSISELEYCQCVNLVSEGNSFVMLFYLLSVGILFMYCYCCCNPKQKQRRIQYQQNRSTQNDNTDENDSFCGTVFGFCIAGLLYVVAVWAFIITMFYAIGLALADMYEGFVGVYNDGIAYNDYFQSVKAWYHILYIIVYVIMVVSFLVNLCCLKNNELNEGEDDDEWIKKDAKYEKDVTIAEIELQTKQSIAAHSPTGNQHQIYRE
eukprot:322421_1